MWRRLSSGVALAAIALVSASAATPAPAALSPELQELLDPVRQARAMCGSPAAKRALAGRLLTAAKATRAAGAETDGLALYPDLAAVRFDISSTDPTARAYFNQGLMLSYGFNHAGAVRSFREAQARDPSCAMCWWGEAVALGPNINAPMDDRDREDALNALARAQALAEGATPLERALIEAVGTRYSADPAADRAALDAAYADAMLTVAARFPDHDEVAVLAAEAVMNTTPWNYWEADKRTPVGRSGEAVRLIETVLARTPDHPQAAHLYIHLLEASDPARAEAAADRLAAQALTAGHLVHMPAHIYLGRGRHADSIRVNVAAARADEDWIRASNDQGLMRYGYYPHNVHFIVASAQAAGDMPTALREAARLRTLLDPAMSERIAWVQVIDAAPYLAMAQFAEPQTILAMPEADPRLPYAQAMGLYARAVAQAQTRDRAGFARSLTELRALGGSDRFADMVGQGVPAPDLIALAAAMAEGRMAYAEGRYEAAVDHYRQAAAIEATIPYTEPAYWPYPARQSLGAALLRAGQAEAAAEAFRAALIQAPDSGWALYGLAEAETARGRVAEAAAAHRALARAWLGDRDWLRLDRL